MHFYEALSILSPNGLNIFGLFRSEISLPNLPWRVPDADAWYWDTLVSWNGLRLQQNHWFRNARIIDSGDVRIAWGTMRGMEMVLDRLARYREKYGA